MIKTKLNIFRSIVCILLAFQLLQSCKTDEVETITPPDRLFAPALFAGTVIENNISLNWTPISNASYSLELSKDSLLFTNELVVIPLDEVSHYSFSDLWSKTRYSARIKAVSKDSKLKDSKYLTITFKTATENIFYNIAATDISTSTVLLKWLDYKPVSKIVFYEEGTENRVAINLTDIEISTANKIITNLTTGTSYIFEIYLGDMLRGTTFAVTL